MLHGQRRQMGIRHQVGTQRRLTEQGAENPRVAGSRSRHPDHRHLQPLFHLLPGCRHGHWPLKHARVGDQPHKRQQGRPGEAHTRQRIELLIQPRVRRSVLRQFSGVGIDEEIGIDEDHRNASPSARASTSAISSRFPTRQRPRETGSV
jgi:hypothetical protein